MSQTLYEISAEIMELKAMMEDEEVDEQVLKDTLEAVNMDFESKMDAYAKVMRMIELDEGSLDAEIERLQARKKVFKNNRERMKEFAKGLMIATGNTKFKTTLFSYSIRKNAPSVKIDALLHDIPVRFLIEQDPVVDNRKLKEAIENEEFDACLAAHLERSESLIIK